MGLVQVATNTVTSAVSSVTLTGIDSSDVYMIAMNNVVPVNNSVNLKSRVTKGGTADTTSNYNIETRKKKAKAKGRSMTILSSSKGVTSDENLILGKKSLLGQ